MSRTGRTQAIDEFKKIRGETLCLLATLSDDTAQVRPRANRWSAGETAHHILLAGDVFLAIVRKCLALEAEGRDPVFRQSFADVNNGIRPLPKAFMPALEIPLRLTQALLPRAAWLMLTRLPIVLLDNPDAGRPERNVSVDALSTRLAAAAQETVRLIESIDQPRLCRMRYSHPLVGSHDLIEAFEVSSAHEERHVRQIRQILEELRLRRGPSALR